MCQVIASYVTKICPGILEFWYFVFFCSFARGKPYLRVKQQNMIKHKNEVHASFFVEHVKNRNERAIILESQSFDVLARTVERCETLNTSWKIHEKSQEQHVCCVLYSLCDLFLYVFHFDVCVSACSCRFRELATVRTSHTRATRALSLLLPPLPPHSHRHVAHTIVN